LLERLAFLGGQKGQGGVAAAERSAIAAGGIDDHHDVLRADSRGVGQQGDEAFEEGPFGCAAARFAGGDREQDETVRTRAAEVGRVKDQFPWFVLVEGLEPVV